MEQDDLTVDDKRELEFLAARDWDKWAESPEGKRCLNAGTLLDHTKGYDVFLKNRLWLAFLAGVVAGTEEDAPPRGTTEPAP